MNAICCPSCGEELDMTKAVKKDERLWVDGTIRDLLECSCDCGSSSSMLALDNGYEFMG